MRTRNLIIYILYLVIGLVLLGLGIAGVVDEFWSGMGSGLLFVSVLRLIRLYRFNKNEDYREKVETEISDERNRFIRNKAWAWAGYIFILISAAAVIVFKLAGQELLSTTSSVALCLMLVLYWVSFFILRKKY